MERIAYLLQYFPGSTDTFIKREIRSLQKLGTTVDIISVWKPKGFRQISRVTSQWSTETTSEIFSHWAKETHFVLPTSIISIIGTLSVSFLRSPLRFLNALGLAYSTARPGFRGFAYQSIYFVQAVLVAEVLRQKLIRHVHNHIGDHGGTVTMLAAKLAGIGYSITFHGWPVFFDAKYSRIKEKVMGAQFTRAISYFCRSQLMMFSECDDEGPFKVVHCGLKFERYIYRPPREKVERLFCVGRLSPEKGHFVLLKALKLLAEKGYKLELGLAGNGPSKGRLEALAKELDLADQIDFLGFMNEEGIIQELQRSDLFVLPSFVEGVPVSAMEAMAIGVPVIATNVAGTSELVENGKTGLLVRPSDTEALAEAVIRMMNDYEFRKRAAELGRLKVEDEFDTDKEAVKLQQYFLECFR